LEVVLQIQKSLVKIPTGSQMLHGELVLPSSRKGIVLFAHGSGSSRHSPRNQYVAHVLQKEGIGTLLFDLLAPEEDEISARFDINLLTERLLTATQWLQKKIESKAFSLGYFGASTGAAAALNAAALLGKDISAVVSRGGRPDLAMEALPRVRAPTLLLVGELDEMVIQLNQKAYDRLLVEKELTLIPGATHLFEEPGTLEKVACFAAEWFLKYFQ
jgi:dienelactone hydrolase